MTAPMPKDNEVDEKVMPEPLTYGLRRNGETDVIGLIPPKVHANPPKVPEYLRDYEEVPLYSAATVAEMRAKADAAERRVGELEAAAKGAMALAWTDTREVEFDPTVILSPDQYDFSGWDCMRMEIHTPSGAWAVWPSGGKFSLYGGPNGLMCFERFSTREEAEERAYREIDRYCPTYPTAIVRKAITGADPT